MRLLPNDWVRENFDGLGQLPHFNPDDDTDVVQESVLRWRRAIHQADVVLISTPEYAHALPGSFKNGLDWLVSDPAFAEKRVVIVKAERGSNFATESLREVLRTMSANVLEEACVGLPLTTNAIDADQILAREELRSRLELSSKRLVAICALP